MEFEKSGDDLQINFPIVIGTVPFRIPNSNLQPILGYGKSYLSFSLNILNIKLFIILDVACDHVEGGIYIGPEFLLGEVYDGCNTTENETNRSAPLYRPKYITVIRSSQQRSASSVKQLNNK